MRRGGFDDNQVCFVSGHKDPRSLQNYDALTVFDKTKMALAMQQAPATLDGEEIDLNALARSKKRKLNEELGEGTSKRQTDTPLFHVVVNCSNDSGFGGSETSSVPPSPAVLSKDDPMAAVTDVNPEERAEVVLSQNDEQGMPKFILSDNNANPDPADPKPDDPEPANLDPTNSQPDATQRAIPSSQAHNVAQLIRDHMASSKELINNYLSAMKKKN